MTLDAFNSLFSMSAFEALRLIRIKQAHSLGLSFLDAVDLIRALDASGLGYNYDAAQELDELIDQGIDPFDSYLFYQECIRLLILRSRPTWARTIPLGRKKFTQKLTQDEVQCFSSAGLLDEMPEEKVVRWWDSIITHTRSFGDESRMIQAREAEKLTLRHELARLSDLGIDKPPVWMAIEDNTVGYDILSYDKGETEPVTKVIEVKSTVASPLRFYVSRNEWNTCCKTGKAYLFHIWDMRNGRLYERSGQDIEPHIPKDSGEGLWSTVEIKLSSTNSNSAQA